MNSGCESIKRFAQATQCSSSIRFAAESCHCSSGEVSCGDETARMLWVGQEVKFGFRMKEESYGARYALVD